MSLIGGNEGATWATGIGSVPVGEATPRQRGGGFMVGKMKCLCGHPNCKDWWLTGIGRFVQGSGFSEAEADRIIAALNAIPPASKEKV